jgi:sugar porter (SP) family MFS transporter
MAPSAAGAELEARPLLSILPSGSSSSSSSSTSYVYGVSFACAISGLLFGYDIGVIDSVLKMPAFMTFFESGVLDVTTGAVTETEAQATIDGDIVSSFLIGCVLGSALSSVMADSIGRRISILVGALVFALGGVAQAIAADVVTLCVARGLSGVAIGILSSITPIYIAEVAPPALRGRMVSVQQLMITIGILLASLVNALMFVVVDGDPQWRGALGAQSVPALFLIVALVFLPYSPRWLMSRGREREAAAVLVLLRGAASDSQVVAEEMSAMRADVEAEGLGPSGKGGMPWSDLLYDPMVRARLSVAVVLQFFQQLTGINFILYFAADLFQRAGIERTQAATTLVIANASLLIIGTLPGLYFVEVRGRRWLLLWGAAGMCTCHALVALFLSLMTTAPAESVALLSYVAIAFIFLFTLAFSAAWGPVVWVVQSEVLPLRARAKGGAVATMTNWLFNALVGKLCPLIVKAINQYIYVIFALTCMLGGIYVYFCVPETMGLALEDIDALFERRGVRNTTKARTGGKGSVELTVSHDEAAEGLAPRGTKA